MPQCEFLVSLLGERLSWAWRLLMFYLGTILPMICHVIAYFGLFQGTATWQLWSFEDKLSFVLLSRANVIFYLLMVYSIVCLTLCLF